MSKNFEFNAPQFINFSNLDDPEGDSFFDIKIQEEQENNKLILNSSIKLKEDLQKKNLNGENQDPRNTIKFDGSASSKKNTPVRKVLHEIVNHQLPNEGNTLVHLDAPGKKSETDILLKLEKLSLTEPKSVKYKTPLKNTEILNKALLVSNKRKSHHMITRLDIVNHRTPHVSSVAVHSEKDNCLPVCNIQKNFPATQLALKMKRNASPVHSARKFISLAEQVEHFHKDTPERYRTKPNKIPFLRKSLGGAKACIPKTPNLTTKFRARKVNFPDEKQREEMELEEIKKHQIKAHPLNEKILLGPSLNLKVPVIKKPTTVPQPFSLTELKKKEQYHEPVFHFKAQPVPSTILHGPVGIPPKKITAPTVPTTPQIRVPLRFRVEVKTPEKTPTRDGCVPPRKTKIEPFSFDFRMKEVLQKKQEYIKRVIEEEKKTFNSFKAQPMPIFNGKNNVSLRSERTPYKTIPQPFNLTQSKTNKSVQEHEPISERVTPFKARPAVVVHQKPFIPKLPKHEVPQPLDFHLNTEKRALERQKFDEKIRQKEEEVRLILQQQKEEEEKLERELALEERKKSEFKAKPMPRYKGFEIHGADLGKLTMPQSPNFSSKLREIKRVNC
ncbi:hypothetical protein RUM43_009467 [Polyplax serrata]|uniref:TPX2 C-terminal domain-containing protein n=1 Tax=Polyplax serrata TaxID=468196 RepID=A0AAN8S4J4_POLSC